MDKDFWHQRWKANQIGFHQNEINPFLVRYFRELAVAGGARVFVPLCGKTLDISWLLSQGCRVAGAELSEHAVRQLFQELNVEPEIQAVESGLRFSVPDLDVFVGDIFDLSPVTLGPVDAVFDRAALVALPEHMRFLYTEHMRALAAKAPQLLVTYEYDQNKISGPPFSIPHEEVGRRYAEHYRFTALASEDVEYGLKGYAARETVWLLSPLNASGTSADET